MDGSDVGLDAELALVVVETSGIREHELPWPEDCVIGRVPATGICIDDASVSRSHARLFQGAAGPMLQDLGSRNGTYINNARIGEDGTPIKLGDALRFGQVAAQLVLRAKRPSEALLVLADEFDTHVRAEAERCVRLTRPFSVVAIELEQSTQSTLSAVRRAVLRTVRSIDVATLRGAGRADVLLRERSKDEARAVALSIGDELTKLDLPFRLGVATFPEDTASAEDLPTAAQRALERVAPGTTAAASSAAEGAPRVLNLCGREVLVSDPAMLHIFRIAERVASLAMPVLVTGETGSGKEIIGEALHALGSRARMPLVKLNCAAVPENLLESELFGHERGAFSGAIAAKPGTIERAHGGTLFLDEIGEMPPSLQAKILRVLEDRRVLRLGATKDREVDVRFVAATHRDLKAAVAEGRFREDLYYRLTTLQVKIPPLRERRRDIVILARRFALQAAEAAGRAAAPSFTPATIQALEGYSWPGNIRELRNVISQAVVFCDSDALDVDQLPPEVVAQGEAPRSVQSVRTPTVGPEGPSSERPSMPRPPPSMSLDSELREIERSRIIGALDACGGNQTKASELLQIPRRTLVSRMAALGIPGRRAVGPSPAVAIPPPPPPKPGEK
jgi:DNA-binding NtrC family response regulator